MTQEQVLLMQAKASLEWAAGGEFSARITPAQARALLANQKAMTEEWNLLVSKFRDLHEAHAALRAQHEGRVQSAIGAPPDFGRSSA